jgi:hypothetical protein
VYGELLILRIISVIDDDECLVSTVTSWCEVLQTSEALPTG